MPDKLQQAISLIKAGDEHGAARLLAEVLHVEPRNETAWLWMSAVVTKPEQRRHCLEQVLRINPNNQMARKGLARLQQESTEPEHPLKAATETAEKVVSSPTMAQAQPAKTKSRFSLRAWLAAIIFIVVGCIGSVVQVFDSADELALQSRGQVTSGVVTDLYYQLGRYGSRSYYVDYQFSSAAGQVYEGSDRIEEDYWNGFEVSGSILILYLPDDPEVNRVFISADDASSVLNLVGYFVCYSVVFLLGVLILAGLLLRRKRSEQATEGEKGS